MVHSVAFASASLGIVAPPAGIIDALDNSIRTELQRTSHDFFLLVLISAFVVAVGVALEGPEILHEIWPTLFSFLFLTSHDRLRSFERAIKKIGMVGWLLVVAGVAGELIFEGLQNRAEGQLQTFSDILLKEARLNAEVAKQSATDAANSATIARDAASSAIDDLRILQSLVSGRQVFDTAPLVKLRLSGRLVYVMSGDAEEAKSFCKSVSADLHDIAGMNTEPSCQSAYAESETIVRGPSLPESTALAEALTEATHFPFRAVAGDAGVPELKLKVLIGPQPSFVIRQKAYKTPSGIHP